MTWLKEHWGDILVWQLVVLPLLVIGFCVWMIQWGQAQARTFLAENRCEQTSMITPEKVGITAYTMGYLCNDGLIYFRTPVEKPLPSVPNAWGEQ